MTESVWYNRILAQQTSEYVQLIKTPEEYLSVCQLRNEVFKEMNYTAQYFAYNSPVQGVLFDEEDTHSAIFVSKRQKGIVGSARAVFDKTEEELPLEKDGLDFSKERAKYRLIAEGGRMIVSREHRGKGNEFFGLLGQLFIFSQEVGIDEYVFGVQKAHAKLYYALGDEIEELQEVKNFGGFDHESVIFAWRPKSPSRILFEKSGLKELLQKNEVREAV